MLRFSVLLMVFAFVSTYGSDTDNINKYIDEILSVSLPKAVENITLDLNEIPDFSFNVQNSSEENESFGGTVMFDLGNVTGLNVVKRKFCEPSSKSPGSISIVCTVVLPRVVVSYRGRYQEITGSNSSEEDQVLYRDFYGENFIRNAEVQIELTTFEDLNNPALTNFLLLRIREVKKEFQYDDAVENGVSHQLFVPFDEISEPFYQKSLYIFQHVFYGPYRNALEKSVAGVKYPEISL
ncbi:uncharacterized protein TNIN_385351 [Trichonephila inaurata madagascariensis]|uniref:Uncharacterized protein n=1 Tax=Trichonephila inaurata madagascariensis TaxID=2747483 RepID=A0A8X6YGU5_9ARAC|nr:uncharacterized protein TNIN_385351 [Trichonephila inaurata madagascariensis]